MLPTKGKGDCSMQAFEIDDDANFCHSITELKSPDAQKGVAVAPRRMLEVSKCEILKVYRLRATSVEPMSVYVPRRNTGMGFQDDLYSDCYAGKPSMTIDE